MIKIKILLAILIVAVLVVAGGLYLTNQLRVSSERIGIYILKNNELVISEDEIVWYDKSSYQIKLTEEGVRKIQALKVESVIYGEPFVVKIGNQEIYNGSFWTPISSVPYHGIVIETLVNTTDNTIKLEKGYPSSDFFKGVDPRNDPRILDHFRKIGKLKQTLKIEFEYNPPINASTLAKFQNEWYIRGSVMHIIDSLNQSIQLRKGDVVDFRLLGYPSDVTEGWFLRYNFVFLNDGSELGDIACEQISMDDPPRFTIPKDGYFVFELGVVNVDAYWFRNSIGVWTFSVTVTRP